MHRKPINLKKTYLNYNFKEKEKEINKREEAGILITKLRKEEQINFNIEE